jgi:transcriptional regulator with XRE-family HTH domain
MTSKLQEYREKLNLTQLELAEKTGISVRTIQRIEAGTIPKGHTLKVLSKALGTDTEDLQKTDEKPGYNYTLIKYINLSTLLFVIPLLNVVAPLFIMFYKKQVNPLTKQIVSIQIAWTLITAFLIIIIPFIIRFFFLDNTLILLIIAVASTINLYIILRNAVALDKKNDLHIKPGFSFL